MSRKLFAYKDTAGIGTVVFRCEEGKKRPAVSYERAPEFDLEFSKEANGVSHFVTCAPDKPKTKTVTRWLNIYADSTVRKKMWSGDLYESEEEANNYDSYRRIACRKITVEVPV